VEGHGTAKDMQPHVLNDEGTVAGSHGTRRRSLQILAQGLAVPLVSFALALLLGGVLIWSTGGNPLAAYRALLLGALVGRSNLELTVLNATPLIFSGLAVALAFRGGLFNIGAEGQVMLGGIVGAWLGSALQLPPLVHIAVTLLAATLAGALWAFPPAIFKVRRGAHEVITTLMMSYVAFFLLAYVRKNILLDPVSTTYSSFTISPSATLPTLSAILPFLHLGYTRVHLGVLIAPLIAAIVWFLLTRTSYGYEIRAVGVNPDAAAGNGINVGRITILSLVVGGALAGLGGGVQLLGLYRRLSVDSFVGLGFAGIFVSLLAGNHPLGVIPAALLFGALQAGAFQMQLSANVPANLVDALQGIIIFVIAAPRLAHLILSRIRRRGHHPDTGGRASPARSIG